MCDCKRAALKRGLVVFLETTVTVLTIMGPVMVEVLSATGWISKKGGSKIRTKRKSTPAPAA